MSEAVRPAHRSVSQLLSFSDCGEAYRLQRRTDAPQRPAGWFVQGSAFHTAVEYWEDSGRNTPEERLHSVYLNAYRGEANELLETHDLSAFMTGGMKKAENDLSDREAMGWWQVLDYQDYARQSAADWMLVGIEQEFRFRLGGVELYGFIDQVRRSMHTGLLFPADLKSGTSVPATPVQLAIYRLALIAEHGEENVADRGVWVHAGRSNARSPKGLHTRDIEVDLTDWSTERLVRWVTDMDAAEKAGLYLPNPKDSCRRMCPVAQWCRAVGWHYPSIEQYAGDLLTIPELALTHEDSHDDD